MCGRIFQTLCHQSLQKLGYELRNIDKYNPSYNIGPTSYIPSIKKIDDQQDKYIDFMKWGYQTKFTLIINARAEEMNEKPTFRPLINSKRCVVLAEGYYEWNTKKEPFMYSKHDHTNLMLAAIYTEDNSVFLLTCDSFGQYADVHNRMPVFLEDNEVDEWVDTKHYQFNDLMQKILNRSNKIWSMVNCNKIAPYVNNIREKGEKCQQSFEEYKEQLHKKGLGRYFQTIKKQNIKEQSQSQIDQITQQLQITDLQITDLQNQDKQNQDLQDQDIQNQDIQNQDIQNQDIQNTLISKSNSRNQVFIL